MDIIEAIEKRISCRAFEDKPIEPEKIEALRQVIAEINELDDLHFELYGPQDFGPTLCLSKKMFANDSPWYAVLAAPAGPVFEERLGYFGEKLVLAATQLDLGTCWVAGTFNRSTIHADLVEGEVLHDVIPIGYVSDRMPLKQRTIRKALRGRSKKLEEMFEGPTPLAEAPEWIQACIDAVGKAPSAINEQPVVFAWAGGEAPIVARLARVRTGKEYTDLGIAKYHFELAAHACGVEGSWEWGDGGAFAWSYGETLR